MLRNASLVLTARLDGALVGAARAISDGVFCCYLSDLAVGQKAQGHGVGAGLIEALKQQIGPQVSLVLVSSEAWLQQNFRWVKKQLGAA